MSVRMVPMSKCPAPVLTNAKRVTPGDHVGSSSYSGCDVIFRRLPP